MTDLKVLIINPPVRLDDKPRQIPHGLAILSNAIRKQMGIEPAFLDINAHRYNREETEKKITQTEFDIVLIGGLAPVYRSIVELSSFIKKQNPDSKIIAGGYVAMPIPDILLKNSQVDIVCTGEGEITIVELLKRFQKKGLNADKSDIKGICYKEGRNNRIYCTPLRPFISNLDEESMLPAFDLIPMNIYLKNPVVGLGRDIDIIAGRGCPFQCTFCYQPFGHKPKYHSVGFIIRGIKYLRKNYNIDFVSFQDDEFMADKKRIRRFCEERNEHFPDLLWSCTGRANIIAKDENIVKLMKDSGCTLISCGFESGSQKILDGMHKRQKIEEMEETVKILRKYELPVPVSFIIGMPGEDEESCQETVNFCLRNNITLDSLMFATPYPGTEIFNSALETGKIDKNSLHEFMMNIGDARDFLINLTDSFSDEQLVKKREEMMRITRENYEKSITADEIMGKMKKLFGNLMDKVKLDEKDLEHRAKHGGMSIF